MIAPIWSTQTWFPKLIHLVCQDSFILPKRVDLLVNPIKPHLKHPLQKMRLGVFRLSENPLKIQIIFFLNTNYFYCTKLLLTIH